MLGYLSQSVDFCIKNQRNEDLDNGQKNMGSSEGSCPALQTSSVTLTPALHQTKTLVTARLVMSLRYQVDQCHGRVECRHRLRYRVRSKSIWQRVQQHRRPSGLIDYCRSLDFVCPSLSQITKSIRQQYSSETTLEIIEDQSTLIRISTSHVKQ